MRGKGNGRGAGRYLYGMTKAEHIAFWREEADFDWAAARQLMTAGDYRHGLVPTLWTLEKLSNVHWVLAHPSGAMPPRTPVAARWQATPLQPSAAQLATVAELEARYESCLYPPRPDEPPTTLTPAVATQLFAEVSAVRSWLLQSLP